MATHSRPSVTIATLGLGRSSLDLTLVVVVLAATTFSVLLNGPAVIRTPLALLLVFFVPGYVLSVGLFPAGEDTLVARMGGSGRARGITLLDRGVISVGLSISTVVLGGLTVDALPPTLSREAILGTLVAVTALAMPIAVYRRRSVPVHDRYAPLDASNWESGTTRGLPALTIARLALVSCILFAGVALVHSGGATEGERGVTELYFQNEPTESAEYPTNLTTDERQSVGVVVGNMEGRPVNYTVIGELQRVERADGLTVQSRQEIVRERLPLPDGETGRVNATVSASETGNYRLVYLLYDGDPPDQPRASTADEEIHLWIDVDDRSPGGI